MEQQQSPPFMVTTIPRPYYYNDPGHASVTPFLGMFLAVVVLGAAAVVVGRLCSGGTLGSSTDRAYLGQEEMLLLHRRQASRQLPPAGSFSVVEHGELGEG
ncbi:hypothetical protein MLD38_001774 [Melastoma candidum]|uniref:Uncharacterized protein n=1 Tax=Melastoma candidum TaxID=119954 RepID=A0ACB9SER1_9MYRT|nr:hypothetical protein MLD38_001774 [Melastoma candidum]